MYVNFKKLKGIIQNDKIYKSMPSIESPEVLTEFTAVLANLIEKGHKLTALELAYITKSIQEWQIKNYKPSAFPNWNIKEIYYADLGIVYDPEFGFSHPVLIIEELGDLALVVPSSTNQTKINAAFHPVDNPSGDPKMRKVKGSEGFLEESALLLSSMRTISSSRFHDKVGAICDDKLFQEIKEQALQVCFPQQFIELRNLRDSQETWLAELSKKEKQIDELRNRISFLESRLEVASQGDN